MSQIEVTNRQLNELTAKYRDMLQRENSMIARSSAFDNLQVSNKIILLLFCFFVLLISLKMKEFAMNSFPDKKIQNTVFCHI